MLSISIIISWVTFHWKTNVDCKRCESRSFVQRPLMQQTEKRDKYGDLALLRRFTDMLTIGGKLVS